MTLHDNPQKDIQLQVLEHYHIPRTCFVRYGGNQRLYSTFFATGMIQTISLMSGYLNIN